MNSSPPSLRISTPCPPPCQSLPNERTNFPVGSNTTTVSICLLPMPWCVTYTFPAASSATLCVVCHARSGGSWPQLWWHSYLCPSTPITGFFSSAFLLMPRRSGPVLATAAVAMNSRRFMWRVGESVGEWLTRSECTRGARGTQRRDRGAPRGVDFPQLVYIISLSRAASMGGREIEPEHHGAAEVVPHRDR